MGVVINGWSLYNFKLFKDRLDELEKKVFQLAHKDPIGYVAHPAAKLLKSVYDVITVDVPSDPSHSKFLLGKTMGTDYTHWRRSKNHIPKRYRLFFRFKSNNMSIVYAWMNDEKTLRKEGSKTDVYTVFKKMLDKGTVPDSYDDLLDKSSEYSSESTQH